MELKVNGKAMTTSAESLKDLLSELDIVPGKVAVEVNLSIVKKMDYSDFILRDGDSIEIVNFVGGGQI